MLPGKAASLIGATGMEFSSKSKLAIETSSNRHFLQSFYFLFISSKKGRVKQKTKESLLFVQVVVIIMNECPEGMQKKHAFYGAKRSYKEVNGKAKT